MWYCYVIQNIVANKYYIGKSKDVKRRWNAHKRIARLGRNQYSYSREYQYLHSAISKYGVKNFTITILDCYDLEIKAFDQEIKLIAQYKTDGYQLYNLTIGGEGVSGHIRSKATKIRMSLAQMGKRASDDTKLKMSLASLDKPKSEEHKRNIALAISGENNHRAKFTWVQVRLIRSLFTTGSTYIELAIQFNVSWNVIWDVCNFRTYKNDPLTAGTLP